MECNSVYNVMVGKKFGRWTVLSEPTLSSGARVCLCVCECGRRKFVSSNNLVRGCSTQCLSCARTKHGLHRSAEYRRWEGMIQRCHNKNCEAYRNYGARGIIVCDKWRNSFENFLKDIGKRPSRKYTLDRINNGLGYFPENCRWATWKEQHNNKRTNHWLECDGEKHTIKQWSEIRGMTKHNLIQRIRLGWDVRKALFTPIAHRARRNKNVV